MDEDKVIINKSKYDRLLDAEKKYNDIINDVRSLVRGEENVLCIIETATPYFSGRWGYEKSFSICNKNLEQYIEGLEKQKLNLSNKLDAAYAHLQKMEMSRDSYQSEAYNYKQELKELKKNIERTWYERVLSKLHISK